MAKSMKRLRLKAAERQGWQCYWCGRTMLREGERAPGLSRRQSKQLRCTAEHLKPRSRGGSNGRDNIVAACKGCNIRRGADTSWTPFEALRLAQP